MALDFPANPTNGQVYDSYVYNSTVGAWQAREDSATVAVTSPTAPATANNGDIWYNSNSGVSYVYYDDGTSAQWVEIVSSAVPALNSKADLENPTFTNDVTITNNLNVNGSDINGDGKTIARFSDAWLRLNPDLDFSSGIYANTSLIRTDNGIQVGANGTNFLATSSALTHNGTDILKKDMRQYYTVGATGTGTSANYYEIFTWTILGQYNNFSAQLQINGRGNTDPRYVVHARGEYGVSTWTNEVLTISSDHVLPDGDTWLLVFSDVNKTAKLYYRRTGNDWNDRSLNFNANWLSNATPVYSNTNFGTVAPTGDNVITKTAPDAIAVVGGGTGATTFTSGAYLKGAGTNALTAQTGVPATDLTGTISSQRFPAGTILQVVSKSDGNAYAASVSTNTWITWPSNRMALGITPRSTTSKILVIVNADLGNSSNDAAIRLTRNGSAIGVGSPPGTGNQLASAVTGMLYATDTNHVRRVVTVNYLDSPGTTDTVFYNVDFSSEGTTMYLNRAPAGSYQNGTYIFAAIGVSTITLMEVAG